MYMCTVICNCISYIKTSPYPQKNKKQLIHFKNAKEREPKEINTSKLKQVFALIFKFYIQSGKIKANSCK
jgi:hypothetical protein